MYIFSDIFFVRFDIYFISSTCHYTYLVFLILAFNTCKDQTVNIFILKKTPVYIPFLQLTHLTLPKHQASYTNIYINPHIYSSEQDPWDTSLTLPAVPDKITSMNILWNKGFKPRKIHCSVITSLCSSGCVPSFEQINSFHPRTSFLPTLVGWCTSTHFSYLDILSIWRKIWFFFFSKIK